jgi:hypothetical protein
MMIFQIEKEGRFIGDGRATETKLTPREGMERLQGYYFPLVHLCSPVVWEVMSGRALGHFFDFSVITDENKQSAGPLRYIHGRSKVMKGTPRISTVLLVDAGPVGLPPGLWLGMVPSIWEEFLRVCNPSVEAP